MSHGYRFVKAAHPMQPSSSSSAATCRAGYASPAVISVVAATGTAVVPPIAVTVDAVPLTLCT